MVCEWIGRIRDREGARSGEREPLVDSFVDQSRLGDASNSCTIQTLGST